MLVTPRRTGGGDGAAQVELGLLDAKSDTVVTFSEATEFAVAAGSGRNRDDVRAEARTAPSHSGMEDCPYVGG